ncbi:hypothetical protein J2Z60_000474 [Lactobacillus colini]|uniref:Type I restriction modification DNA specificity domain-containing protein n=1 Tax=Lactobacillus colini TaxID=1819254 RepID=A0ABS4MC92_9LACO|nr:restriction endonuclease subunit S [Lactobacillus colini]MBP2057310.1 hypothetical protein [Lactobacillus colini]
MTEFKSIKISDIFSTPGKGDVDLQQSDVNGKGEYFINSGETNLGIKGRTSKPARVFSANTITIDFWGNAYYRDFEYKLATHNHVFSFDDDVIKNKEVGLYLVGALRFLKSKFSYMNMLTWNKLKELKITLPVVSGTNDIDFQYMEDRVKALEQDRVKALANYLAVTGLDDYQLTDIDKEVLSYKPEFHEFKFSEIFSEPKKGDVDLQQRDVNGKGEYFINSGETNLGIKGRTDRPARIFPADTITIDFFGNSYYRDFSYKLATHNHVFSFDDDVIKNKEVGIYLIGALNFLKQKFSYSNMLTWNKLKKLTVALPVKPGTIDIDFDYMERYIKAIQKVTIKNVVKYKDEVINETKKIIS